MASGRPLTGARIETSHILSAISWQNGSPPHGGADRNTTAPESSVSAARVAPSRGRGSKHRTGHVRAARVDRELTHRRDKRLAARLRYARLRQQASVEDVDYRAPRGLDRALFHKLTNSEWIDAHDNLILCGPTGVGKSWLACALGHLAALILQRLCLFCAAGLGGAEIQPLATRHRQSARSGWHHCS